MRLFGFDTTIQFLQSIFGHFPVRFLSWQVNFWQVNYNIIGVLNEVDLSISMFFNEWVIVLTTSTLFFCYKDIFYLCLDFCFFNRLNNSEKMQVLAASFGWKKETISCFELIAKTFHDLSHVTYTRLLYLWYLLTARTPYFWCYWC